MNARELPSALPFGLFAVSAVPDVVECFFKSHNNLRITANRLLWSKLLFTM